MTKPVTSDPTTATNVGGEPCPFGAGAHPYLLPDAPLVDSAMLHLPARTLLDVDTDGIPVGVAPVDGTEFDFLQRRPIGVTRLTTASPICSPAMTASRASRSPAPPTVATA